jgi:predicted O-methyltransferase YrrM
MNPVDYALNIPGWMTNVELGWISKTAAGLKPGSVWAEVGTWMGRSWSCAALSLPEGSTIIAVDTFMGEYLEPLKYVQDHGSVLPKFEAVVADVKRQRPDLKIHIFTERSVEAAVHVARRSCDVVFIDCDHRTEAVIADNKAWRPKLKIGGLLCGHDGDDPGVIAALERLPFTMDPSARGSIWCAT